MNYLKSISVILLIFIQCQQAPSSRLDLRWTEERAWDWKKRKWMDGRYKL